MTVNPHAISSQTSKAQLIRDLYQKVPKNTLGLPEGIYRPDLLPNFVHSAAESRDSAGAPPCSPHSLSFPPEGDEELGESQEVSKSNGSTNGSAMPPDPISEEKYLKAAYVPISYAEGFPVLPEGLPFWMQMSFEPPDAFQAFTDYLAQGNDGARQLFLLEADPEHADGSTALSYSLRDLHDFFYLYYWSARARSYDLFRVAQFRKVNENRAMSLQQSHFSEATNLFKKCMEYINSEDFMDQLTPKAAVDLLKTVVQLQRVSVGLQANAPNAPKEASEGASLEVILRQIAHSSSDGVSSLDAVNQADDDGAHLELALKDPATAAMAQELVIRLNQPRVIN